MSSSRRHFAQFDDELHDSDQTISTSVRHLRHRARLPTVADASNSSSDGSIRPTRRRFPTSAFFSDTTDDDVSRPITKPSDHSQFSTSAYSCPTQTKSSRAPLYMSAGPREGRRETRRLHVDTIQFPTTRSVLWDRRRLSAESIGVSLEQIMPRFIISAGALKEIYRLYEEKNGVRGSDAALCYLYGDATSPRVKKVFLEGVRLKKEDARAAGTWCVPVHTIADGKNPGLSQESYVSTIQTVQSSYRDEYTDNVASKLQPELLVFRSSPHAAQLDFQLEVVAAPVLFKYSLVRNLPLLMTPLAASLAKCEFSTHSGNMRSGYLTLDRTRKAVPLLKVDPLVLQQPLVGVWVYGVHIDDAWDEDTARRQLADPLLYFACIGYLMSGAINERVSPERNTFLVALYPARDPDSGGAVASMPRFFECSFSEFLSPAKRLPMELYSDRRSCLVGVSKFSTDVELTLSGTPTCEWEAARREAKIPTVSRFTDDQNLESFKTHVDSSGQEHSHGSRDIATEIHSEGESEDITSGWTITADAIRTGSTDKNAQSQASALCEKEADTTAITSVEIKEKPQIPTSGKNLHDETCTRVIEDVPPVSPPNETEGIAGPSQRGNAGNNTTYNSYRSCCKTQQLLTIQHQQILENQQRQLHEMQEQIAQLRRLLHAARNSKDKQAYPPPNDEGSDSDASSSSIGAVADVSNVSTTFSRNGNGQTSSQSSMVLEPRRSGDALFSEKSSVHAQQENENGKEEEEEKDVSLSSLGLSSISSGSDADFSSLSSSLLNERLKQSVSSQSRGKEPASVKEVDLEAEVLTRSQLSQLSECSTKMVNQPKGAEASVDVEPSTERTDEGHEDAEKTGAQNLSIGELSASVEESNTEANKTSVILASREEVDGRDTDANASGDDPITVERMLPPDVYLRKVGGFVDHHGGCFTTPPLDFHSFCVPRIKFSSEAPECSLSDSEDEEIRLIEQKYKRLMAARTAI